MDIRTTTGALTTGVVWEGVIITPADDIAYDRAARANRWPSLSEAPLTAQAFLAFAATRRVGLHELTWEDWTAAAIAADVDTEAVDPQTLPARVRGGLPGAGTEQP